MKIRLLFTIFISIAILGNTFGQGKFRLPKLFGKEKGTTQWYGDPVSEPKLKNNYNVYATVGLGGGTSNYYGDFTSYKYPFATILKMTRWNFSANYTKHFSYNFAARISVTAARIAGDDGNFENAEGAYLNKYSRGLHFRNTLKEIGLVGIYDFTRYRKGGYRLRPQFTPYAFAGLAIANHNPEGRAPANPTTGAIDKSWFNLRQFDAEGQGNLGEKQYSTVAFAIPFGAGLRYKLADQWDISAEGGLRYTVSEGGRYLDDVSANYIPTAATNTSPTQSEIYSYRADELFNARTGKARDFSKITLPVSITGSGDPAKRGNGRQDFYFLTAITLNYYIPSQIKCFPNLR